MKKRSKAGGIIVFNSVIICDWADVGAVLTFAPLSLPFSGLIFGRVATTASLRCKLGLFGLQIRPKWDVFTASL